MKPLVYGSVCSGIGAPEYAWSKLGWRCAFMSEIDAFPRAVLSHRFPEHKLHGDFTTIERGHYEPIDLLVGGTPCQAFSVAGLRRGMADDRGNLALEYILLADRLRPRWLVWENVPGVFSSRPGDDPEELEDEDLLGHNGGPVLDDDRAPPGSDFAAFLSGLVRWEVPIPDGGWRNSGILSPAPVDGAYGVAWRVYDSQFAGVPQRRRRVFVVGYLGDWRPCAAVLLEPHSLSGDPPPRREAGEGITGTIGASAGDWSRDNIGECAVAVAPIPFDTTQITHPANRSNPQPGDPCGTLAKDGHAPTIAYPLLEVGARTGVSTTDPRAGIGIGEDGDPMFTLQAGKQHGVAFALRGRDEDGAVPEIHLDGQTIGTLRAADGGSSRDYVAFASATEFLPQSSRVYSETELSPALQATGKNLGNRAPQVATASAVRRLTPVECERLQAFPDGWTMIPWRGKPSEECPDGPRYKGLGNSMTTNVVEGIGRQIALVDALTQAPGTGSTPS